MPPLPPDTTTLDLTPAERTRFADLAVASHATIARYQDPCGAYPASPTFSAYAGYAWLRDGAFTAEGMSRYGDSGSVDRFHGWVNRLLTQRRPRVDTLVHRARAGKQPELADMLPTRFTFTGQNGSDPWWDFQTDGYGMWMWALVTHAQRHNTRLTAYQTGIEVVVDYLTTFWQLPCYDWWEEHVQHRHVSTLAAIYGGLDAIIGTGVLDSARQHAATGARDQIRALVLADGVHHENGSAGYLVKWVGSTAVDGSLPSAIVPFGLLPPTDPIAAATLKKVAADLDHEGGVHRFLADVFYGGGQWPLLAALLGWNLAAAGDTAGALRHLHWIADHATTTDELPEQVPDHLLHPHHRQDWLDRWGPVATPLLWSHGMYLILADELGLLPPTERR